MEEIKVNMDYDAPSKYNTEEEYLSHIIDEWERLKSSCDEAAKRKILKIYIINSRRIRELFPEHQLFPEVGSVEIKLPREALV
jgi:hypothetical protein